MDAVVAMEGNGSSGGSPRIMELLAASGNPFALDFVCADFIGNAAAGCLNVAGRNGARALCPRNLQDIALLGADPAMFRQKDFYSRNQSPVILLTICRGFAAGCGKDFDAGAKIRRRECVGCGKLRKAALSIQSRLSRGKQLSVIRTASGAIVAKRCARSM